MPECEEFEGVVKVNRKEYAYTGESGLEVVDFTYTNTRNVVVNVKKRENYRSVTFTGKGGEGEPEDIDLNLDNSFRRWGEQKEKDKKLQKRVVAEEPIISAIEAKHSFFDREKEVETFLKKRRVDK